MVHPVPAAPEPQPGRRADAKPGRKEAPIYTRYGSLSRPSRDEGGAALGAGVFGGGGREIVFFFFFVLWCTYVCVCALRVEMCPRFFGQVSKI